MLPALIKLVRHKSKGHFLNEVRNMFSEAIQPSSPPRDSKWVANSPTAGAGRPELFLSSLPPSPSSDRQQIRKSKIPERINCEELAA